MAGKLIFKFYFVQLLIVVCNFACVLYVYVCMKCILIFFFFLMHVYCSFMLTNTKLF